MKRHRLAQTWLSEIDDLYRAIAGGFLFGIPLLYTMEVWWVGSYTSHPQRLTALVITYSVVFLLNRTAGFRKLQGIQTRDALMDSVEALGIGLICATVVLVLLREITSSTPIGEAFGKLILEAVPFSLGVALANQYLGHSDDSQSQPTGRSSKSANGLDATLADIGATLTGAVIVALNIAPTEEVPMLAAAVSPLWLLLIMVASLGISYLIVFEADFANQAKRRQQHGIFQRPLSETVMAYLLSLLAAMAMLYFFQQLSFSDPWSVWLSYTLLLGFPATVGGAAGRLAI